MKTMKKNLISWAAGIAVLACALALYLVYSRRNWALLSPVVEMIRPWWYALRLSVGL